MSSTRLPGKVLKTIDGKTLLWYVVKRLQQVKTPVKIVIATGGLKANNPIIDFCKKNGLNYYVGDENDVLDRYYQTARHFNGQIIVRITSDCPLIDPQLIDQILQQFLDNDFDYISNTQPPTYPDGYDTEVFTFQALEKAWKEAELPSEREHVTPYIWKNEKGEFKLKKVKNEPDYSDLRLTVDTQEDLELISIIIKQFSDRWDSFNMEDVIEFLVKNEGILDINAKYDRDEGYAKSLEEDKQFLKKKEK